MSTVRIQVRRGTAAQWTSVNPILAAGELGVESDTNLFKFGNGSSTWTALSYANNSDVAIGEISQDAINTALTMGAGLTKTYNDGANTITIAVDSTVVTATGTQTLTNKTITSPAGLVKADVGLGNVDNTSDANKPVSTATQTALDLKANTSGIAELAQDAVNTALTPGTGISKTYDDSANTITVGVDTTVIADRSWVTGQITTLSNTVDNGFLEVADRGAQGGVASLDQNTLVPQAQILEPVQDIVAAMTNGGRGLNTSYNDTTGALTLTPSISARNGISIEDAANNAIGLYLDPVINASTKLTTPLVEAATVSASTVTTGDITISGNMTVNGTTTTVNSTNVSIDDPMIYMGDGNQSNALDLGFVAAFNNGTYQHSGLVRDASENQWVLFSGVVPEPTTVVDFTTYTKDNLVVGGLNATAATIGNVSNSEIQHLDGVTSAIQTQINTINTNASTAAAANQSALDLKLASATAAGTYAPIASPTFTGTVIGVTKSMVGLGNVDNTADSAKPISTAAQTALDLKAPLASPALTGTPTAPTAAAGTSTTQVATTAFVASTYAPLNGPTFTGSVSGITKSMVGLANVDNTTDAGKPVSSATQTALDLKANLASPTFTGTVSGITKSMVGLGSVDNTADSAKPVSTAAQTALDLKLASATAASTYAPIASPTFTGTVSGVTKSHVGLGNVDNTADSAKPVSTAAQTALDLKAPLASPALTGVPTAPTAAAATNTTQVATTAYVRGEVAALVNSAGATLDTLGEIATALGNDANLSTTLTTSIGLKAPIASPTFTGTVTVAAAGIAFTDGTQTREGVPSRTTISQKTASYTLSALTERDSMIEMNSASATTLTVPTNATVAYPVGTSIDLLRVGAGAVDVAAAAGVTINATPGLKLRAQWSSATLIKRATDTWVLVGDLSA